MWKFYVSSFVSGLKLFVIPQEACPMRKYLWLLVWSCDCAKIHCTWCFGWLILR